MNRITCCILLLAAHFLPSCSAPEKDPPMDGYIALSNHQVRVYTYSQEPCGCMRSPVAIDTCQATTDGCFGDCTTCIEKITLLKDGQVLAEAEHEFSTDLTLIHRNEESAGTALEIVLTGCNQELKTEVILPEEIQVEMQTPVFEDAKLQFQWTPMAADVVEVSAGHGFGGNNCWTKDSGSYKMDWVSGPLMHTSVSLMYKKKTIEHANFRLDLYHLGADWVSY